MGKKTESSERQSSGPDQRLVIDFGTDGRIFLEMLRAVIHGKGVDPAAAAIDAARFMDGLEAHYFNEQRPKRKAKRPRKRKRMNPDNEGMH